MGSVVMEAAPFRFRSVEPGYRASRKCARRLKRERTKDTKRKDEGREKSLLYRLSATHASPLQRLCRLPVAGIKRGMVQSAMPPLECVHGCLRHWCALGRR